MAFLDIIGRPGGRRAPEPAGIVAVDSPTPGVRRLTLGGSSIRERLAAMNPGPATWLKLFPPAGDGRAYTIRSHDAVAGTITIDIVLHGLAGDHTVAAWARTARAGDPVAIGGFREAGFSLLPDTQWLWLAVDAAALPAAYSIIAALPAGVTVYLTALAHDADERQTFDVDATLEQTWIFGNAEIDVPPPQRTPAMTGRPGQAWIAGESGWAKRTKTMLLESGILIEERIAAKGYWKIGESGHRDRSGRDRRR